jgi:tRNA(adenine34) deaminase
MTTETPEKTGLGENSQITEIDAQWMREALRLASHAAGLGEVPVGAVIVKDGQIIGRGWNTREKDLCATRHAEMMAIEEANRSLGSWRLSGCDLYVTLEPCIMCAGALHQVRIGRVFFGALDPKAGACGSLYRVHEDTRLNHRWPVVQNLLAAESRDLLQDFFRSRRKTTRSDPE